jgi:uncharacterized protein YraI
VGAARPVRPIVAWGVALALLASALPLVPAAPTAAAEGIALPFPGGQAVRIVQGYSGASHRGRSHYALDLVLAEGSTGGAEVVSPIEGSVSWAQGPGAGNGCLAIAFRDGSYSITLCHVLLNRAYRAGESIARGQSLGTVGRAGSVGNGGTPHVHLELHRGGRSSSPVPFSPPDGLALDGVALAPSGTYSEHSRRAPIVSANRGGGGTVLASSTLPGRAPQPVTARPAPAQPVAAAATTTATRAAIVHGTGSCLKVRTQPSADAPAVDCLPEGTAVPLVAAAGGAGQRWRQVEGKGWVAGEYLRRTRAVVAGTEACLNVREGPSTGARLLGCLPEGTSVTIVEGPTRGGGFDWYRIEGAPSLEKGGWLVGRYLD